MKETFKRERRLKYTFPQQKFKVIDNEKMFTITTHQGNANQSHNEVSLDTKMAKIKD